MLTYVLKRQSELFYATIPGKLTHCNLLAATRQQPVTAAGLTKQTNVTRINSLPCLRITEKLTNLSYPFDARAQTLSASGAFTGPDLLPRPEPRWVLCPQTLRLALPRSPCAPVPNISAPTSSNAARLTEKSNAWRFQRVSAACYWHFTNRQTTVRKVNISLHNSALKLRKLAGGINHYK